jgi:hypothetical protein
VPVLPGSRFKITGGLTGLRCNFWGVIGVVDAPGGSSNGLRVFASVLPGSGLKIELTGLTKLRWKLGAVIP